MLICYFFYVLRSFNFEVKSVTLLRLLRWYTTLIPRLCYRWSEDHNPVRQDELIMTLVNTLTFHDQA